MQHANSVDKDGRDCLGLYPPSQLALDIAGECERAAETLREHDRRPSTSADRKVIAEHFRQMADAIESDF